MAGLASNEELLELWGSQAVLAGAYPPPRGVSVEARDMLSRLFTKAHMRITIPEIKAHPWFASRLPRHMTVRCDALCGSIVLFAIQVGQPRPRCMQWSVQPWITGRAPCQIVVAQCACNKLSHPEILIRHDTA